MIMHRRWWILGALGMSAVVVAAAGSVWFHSTADLDAVAEHMRALGLPTALEEVWDREQRDEAECMQLVALDEVAKSWDLSEVFANTDGLEGDAFERTYPRDRAGEPLWAMLVAHGAQAAAQLRSGADALPERPVRAGTPAGLRAEAEVFAGPAAVTALALLAASESDPEPDLLRAIRVITAQPLHVSSISGIGVQRSRGKVLRAMAGRWPDVRGGSRSLAAVAAWTGTDPRTLVAAAHELRVLLAAWRNAPAMEIAKGFNITMVSDHWFDRYGTHPWSARLGRAGSLILAAELLARGGTLAECADAVRREEDAQRSRWSMIRDPAGAVLFAGPIKALFIIRREEAKNAIFARLLVALIRREPIPVDPTDPAGGPLRRYERDGVLIGYYACGDDGVDNGGSTADWRFPFDRPWDPPAAP